MNRFPKALQPLALVNAVSPRPCLIAQMILPGGCPETELSAAGQDKLEVAESGVAHTLSFSFLFNLLPVAMQG